MLMFSSQTLSLGNWITRKQEEVTPPHPTPLKMLLSKGSVFLLRTDPASEGPTVQKLQKLFPPPHTHTVRMAENKERGGEMIIITVMIIKIYGYILIEINK